MLEAMIEKSAAKVADEVYAKTGLRGRATSAKDAFTSQMRSTISRHPKAFSKDRARARIRETAIFQIAYWSLPREQRIEAARLWLESGRKIMGSKPTPHFNPDYTDNDVRREKGTQVSSGG